MPRIASRATAHHVSRTAGAGEAEEAAFRSAESFGGTFPSLAGFHFAIARRGIGRERIDQAAGRVGDLPDGRVEGGFVDARRVGRAAELADELQRRRVDLVVRRGWLEIGERLDVPAHGDVLEERFPADAGKYLTGCRIAQAKPLQAYGPDDPYNMFGASRVLSPALRYHKPGLRWHVCCTSEGHQGGEVATGHCTSEDGSPGDASRVRRRTHCCSPRSISLCFPRRRPGEERGECVHVPLFGGVRRGRDP